MSSNYSQPANQLAQQQYPLSSQLQNQFNELSRNRDTPSESITEEKFIPTEDGGYIHEVTSRTTPRRRPDSGEDVSTVTQRRVATIGNPDGHTPAGSLSLKYTSKSLQSSRSPSTNSYYNTNNNNNQGATPSSSTGGNSSGVVVSPGPSSYNFNGGAENLNTQRSIPNYANKNNYNNNQSNHGANWRYNQNQANFQNEPTYYDQQQMNSMAPPSSGSRNVKIGATHTAIVEPFRISPLNPERNYAPLKYVTRRQLREMQRRGGAHRNLPNKMRTSSVPRLDEMLIEEQQRNMHFNSNNGNYNDRFSEYPPQEDYGPRAFSGEPDTRMFYAGENNNNNRRSMSQHSAASSGIRPYYNSQYMNQQRQQNGGASPSVGYYGGGGGYTTAASLPAIDGDDMVRRFAYALRRVNSVHRRHLAEMPAYCGAAMRLLYRGTYLIHYGYQPHERYFMLRMLKDPIGRTHPYFVWSLHSESASYIEKIHLAHLIGMGRGTSSDRFQKYVIDNRRLVGPFIGDEPSKVSNKYAFSFVFESQHASRRVDVLALDDQTYRCWLLVCDYLADINNVARRMKEEAAENGEEYHGDEDYGDDHDDDDGQQSEGYGDEYGGVPESMAPDTPRSHA